MCNTCFWVYKMYLFVPVCNNTDNNGNLNGINFNVILKHNLVVHRT
jgi:hypothetical protein